VLALGVTLYALSRAAITALPRDGPRALATALIQGLACVGSGRRGGLARMARGMTAPEARPVTDLLRAVRARVWKQGAIDLLATALWPSGVLTLALGLVHVSATDLPATGALLAGACRSPWPACGGSSSGGRS